MYQFRKAKETTMTSIINLPGVLFDGLRRSLHVDEAIGRWILQSLCRLFSGNFGMVEAPRGGKGVTNGSRADLRRQRLYS